MDLGVRGMSVGENQSSLGGPVGGGDGAAQSTPGVASPQQQPQQPRRPQYAEVTGEAPTAAARVWCQPVGVCSDCRLHTAAVCMRVTDKVGWQPAAGRALQCNQGP